MALLDYRVHWAARMFSEFAPFHPLFITIAASSFAVALYRLYGAPVLSAMEGSGGPDLRGQRTALWVLTAVSLVLILFPVYGPSA